jgi:hypothetical protein
VKNAKVAAGGYLTTGTWTVRLTLTDVLGGVAVAQATVGTAFTHLSLGGGNTAAAARVAFGKLAELDNTVDNALKLRQRAAAEFNAGLTVTAGSTSLNSGVVANRGIAGLEAGNLFCDPTLAGGGAGWASKPSGVATVTGLTPAAPDGSTTAAQFTMAANTQKTWGQAGEPSTAPGEIWRIRFYVRRTTDGTAGTAGVTVRFRPNRGGTAVYHSVKVDTSALVKNEWKLVEGTVVTPAGCNSAWGYLDASANMAAGEVIQFTNVRCVRAENQPPMMAPALGQLGAVNFEAANDSAWHEEGVGITLERGVWEVEASGSVRTTGNAACWYQLRVFDGSTLIAAGHQYRAHSEGRATDLPVKCRVFVAVDAAKTYSARLNASVDAGSNAAMYFSYIQFTAARRG